MRLAAAKESSMSKSSSTIKTLIPVTGERFAAFLPDKVNDSPYRVEPIICWSLVTFEDEDDPDEVIGQIIDGDSVVEVTYVDDEEGFGRFLGYFISDSDANTAIMLAVAEGADEDEEEDDEDEEPKANADPGESSESDEDWEDEGDDDEDSEDEDSEDDDEDLDEED